MLAIVFLNPNFQHYLVGLPTTDNQCSENSRQVQNTETAKIKTDINFPSDWRCKYIGRTEKHMKHRISDLIITKVDKVRSATHKHLMEFGHQIEIQ